MTEAASGAGVLSGIKVVDFGHFVAGPLTAVMLADQGAEVVHVDRPGAELAEADAFLNRGKRRITLDLKDPADAAVATRLAAGADVVIENFRPGVMDRLGLGWPRLAATAPRLIYCSLPGFGRDDPRAPVPGWEGVVAAATANCSIRVGQEPEGWDTSRPTYSAVPLASNFAAFLAATATVAALTFRHRTGRGQLIEVPLFHAMFELIGKAGAFVQSDGLAPPKPHRGNGSGTYECADGRYVRMDPIGGSARFLRWLLDAAGAESWAADGLTDGVRLAQHKELEEELKERLRGLFLTRTAQEWGELAGDAGVPLAFIRTCREWLRTPHARAAGHVVPVADPLFGETWMPGLPVNPAASAGWTPRPRRLPDADHDAVVAEASRPAAAPRRRAGGGHHRGVRGTAGPGPHGDPRRPDQRADPRRVRRGRGQDQRAGQHGDRARHRQPGQAEHAAKRRGGARPGRLLGACRAQRRDHPELPRGNGGPLRDRLPARQGPLPRRGLRVGDLLRRGRPVGRPPRVRGPGAGSHRHDGAGGR